MDSETLLILVLFLGIAGGIVYFVSSQIKSLKKDLTENKDDAVLMEWLKEMRGSVDKSGESVDKKLSENSQTLLDQLSNQRRTMEEQLKTQREAIEKQTKLIWERLEDSSKTIQQVHKELGGITEFGKDMKDLSNVLKSPKLRGGLGEQSLYEILQNILPADLFQTQFKFKDGSTADAVIKTDRGLIPIDSKFPLENFKAMLTLETQEERDRVKKVFIRDVKARIDEISQKYILPAEGTSDFAVMYVPSENIFYELIVNTPEIDEYSRQKSIFLTSPNTLSYQIKSILVAYQQTKLQKHAGEILKALSGIKGEAGKFNEELDLLEKHIRHTYSSMETVRSKFTKLFGRIENVSQLGSGEKPLLEE